ncbi:MAG: BON domain-containing protein [Flavisolibacter sp.]|nr:BON domain-containing protein [Flavisolibacter sp.]
MENNNRNWGNQSDRYQQDWDRNRNRNDRGYDQNQNYGDRGYNRDEYRDMRNVNYGDVYHGNVEQRERETNQAQGRGYGSEQGNREQYYGSGQYGQNYGSGYRETGNRNMNYESYRDQDYRRGYEGAYGYTSGNYDRDLDTSHQQGYYNDQNRRYQNQDYSDSNRNYEDRNRRTYDRNWWERTKDEVSSWFGDRNDDDRRRESDYRTRGEHHGKGPRGYKRSDERIMDDVCQRLYDDDYIDASDIEVKVEGADVILSGTVHNREEKRRAEDLAERISGVRNVENRLHVKHDDDKDRSDFRDRYTGTTDDITGIGRSSGTTNEIIRNEGNRDRNR